VPPNWLTGLSLVRGYSECIRSDNGLEFYSKAVRDELDEEIFFTLAEAKYIVSRWRMDYNYYRSHRLLPYLIPLALLSMN